MPLTGAGGGGQLQPIRALTPDQLSQTNFGPASGGVGARYVQSPKGGYPGPFGNFNLGFGGPGGGFNFSGGGGTTGGPVARGNYPSALQGGGGGASGGGFSGGGSYGTSGGGGSAGGGPGTAPAGPSYSGPGLTNTATVDPRLQQYLTDVGTQKAALTAGTDIDAQNAMARQQQSILGMARGQQQGVASRGFEGGGGAGLTGQLESQVFGSGQRSLADLNAQMAAGSRQAQLQALGMQGGAASDISRQLATSNQLGLNQWQAGANEQFRNAQLAAMLQNQGFNQFMGIAGLGLQMGGLGMGGFGGYGAGQAYTGYG